MNIPQNWLWWWRNRSDSLGAASAPPAAEGGRPGGDGSGPLAAPRRDVPKPLHAWDVHAGDFTDLAPGCPACAVEPARDELAEFLRERIWGAGPSQIAWRTAHSAHVFDSACAICRGDCEEIASAILAAGWRRVPDEGVQR